MTRESLLSLYKPPNPNKHKLNLLNPSLSRPRNGRHSLLLINPFTLFLLFFRRFFLFGFSRINRVLLCRQKPRMTLSIKQLEEDPLLETLDKVIPQVCYLIISVDRMSVRLFGLPILIFNGCNMTQDGADGSDSLNTSSISNIEPLQGLETIFEELLKEDGYGTCYRRKVYSSCSCRKTGELTILQVEMLRVKQYSPEQNLGEDQSKTSDLGLFFNKHILCNIFGVLGSRNTTDNITRSRRYQKGVAASFGTNTVIKNTNKKSSISKLHVFSLSRDTQYSKFRRGEV
ncbi:hypothetical protein CsatA_005508 [Cannabis sativa]